MDFYTSINVVFVETNIIHAMDDGEGWRSLAICVAWCCIDVFGVVVMCFKLLGVVSVCFRLLGVVL